MNNSTEELKIFFDLRALNAPAQNEILNTGQLKKFIKQWGKDKGISLEIIDTGKPIHDKAWLSFDMAFIKDDIKETFINNFKETRNSLASLPNVHIVERHMEPVPMIPGNTKEPRWLHIHLQKPI